MKRDSVKIAASALTLTTVVNALIQSFIANSEHSASSGRRQKTEGKKKSIGSWGDREIINKGIRKSGYQRLDIGNEELGTENYCPESSIRLLIFLGCHSHESGNPDVVPAEAGNHCFVSGFPASSAGQALLLQE